jgi:uncharacterized membrane protein
MLRPASGEQWAALCLSAPTIRACRALFNFQSNIFSALESTRAGQLANFIHPSKIGPVSFPSPAIYNRQSTKRVPYRSLNLIEINLPSDFNTNLLMLFRWLHFVGGIAWLGLLYFFNLVNVPFMKGLDPATKGKILPGLMSRALWWFRWGSVLTVLMGLAYWGSIVASDARNADAAFRATSGVPMGTFFGIWTVVWALMYAFTIPGKGALDKGPVLAVIYTIIVVAASCLFLRLNDHGWESNRLLAIGIGGGMGWVMMLNVWGVIWRAQKKIIRWTTDNAANGTAIPDKAKYLARQTFLTSRANFVLSFPMLFLMGAASHYPMFGK